MNIIKSLYFSLLICAAALLATLNYVGITYNFYWQLDWFDIVPHFLGGLCVGLFSLSVLSWSRLSLSSIMIAVLLVLTALSVGTLWEVLEYLRGVEDLKGAAYPFDTASDLVLDVAGALSAWVALARTAPQSAPL